MSEYGIHHVTAMAGKAQGNIDFYTRVLGMRLVKKTVNFDDPGTYHFYYGDAEGRPGSVLTFFPWENAAPGRRGAGETVETAFAVPEASIGFWISRFVALGVDHDMPVTRGGRKVVAFRDHDGTNLALVASARPLEGAWHEPGIPAQHAIGGFAGVTLDVPEPERTAELLVSVLGFTIAERDAGRMRLEADAGIGATVELVSSGAPNRPRLGAGSVHHVAFRARDDAAQAEMARKLQDVFGIVATEQKDRNYFRSIYFREPGGVLFEIATDSPGFTVDEPPDVLGMTLKLPPFLERRRKAIEAALPPLA